MICKGCYSPTQELNWASHSQEMCKKRKCERQQKEHQEICNKHPREESPALLLGGICPLCSPNLTVRAIEPDILRIIHKNKLKKPFSFPIYSVNNASQTCDYQKSINCTESSCMCKRVHFADNPATNLRATAEAFWSDYKANVNLSFDHNAICIPYAKPEDASPPPSPLAADDFDAGDLVEECKMADVDLFAFAIKNPPLTVQPHHYLSQFSDKIFEFMRSSESLSNRKYDSFKLWIWAHSHFVRVNKDGNLDVGDDDRDIKKHNTFNFFVPGFNGGLTMEILRSAIDDLQLKFDTVNDQMVGSGWAFQMSTEIKIVMAKVEHRLIARTKKNMQIVKNYRRYHKGWRGSRHIINFNYMNKEFMQREDVCKEWENKSPCVKYALKIFKILHNDQLANKNKIISNLLGKQVHRNYSEESKQAILNTKVSLPEGILNHGVQLKDFAALEKANEMAIAVYYIKPPETSKKKNADPTDPKTDVTITCLRAPKPSIIRKYGGIDKVCNMALLSTDHVALIPDIFAFNQTTMNRNVGVAPVGRPLKDRRCPFCFGPLYNREMLLQHIDSGVCINKSSQPARVVMPPAGSVINHEIKGATESPLLTVVLDMESKLLTPRDVTIDDFVFDVEGELNDSTFTKKDNIIHYHEPQSIGICFLDKDHNKLGYHPLIVDNVQDIFPNELTSLIEKYSEIVKSRLCNEAYLTEEQEDSFQKCTNCARCNKLFTNTKKGAKHRHHCHHTFPIFDAKGKILEGNYLGALCNFCNWKATGKRKQAVCVMHNGTNYDFVMLLKGLTNDIERIKEISVLPKSSSGYINIKFKNASFIDTCSFIKASLSELVDLKCKNVEPKDLYKSIPITVQTVREIFGEEVTQYLGRKQVYPYTLAKSVLEMEKITDYPDQSAFFNHLTDKHISSEDYQFGKVVWEALKKHFPQTMSLRILHEFYLCSDVTLLADVWSWYSKLIEADFQMDATSCITGPGLIYQAALFMGGTDVELINDYSIYLDFEQGIRGGLVTATKRRVVCNTADMGEDYDSSEDRTDETIVMVDWNGLYPSILTRSMPYANYEYVADVEQFKDMAFLVTIDTSDNALSDYYLVVSLEIPEYLKVVFDDFPLIIVNCNIKKPSVHTAAIGSNINHTKSVKLVCGHFNMAFYGIDLELLQFYIKVGVTLTDVHRVISYSKKPIFKPFIDHCTKRRMENINNAVLNKTYKLLANALYGRCLMDQRKYNLNSRLVDRSQIKEEISHPKFHQIRKVSKKAYLVSRSKESVVLRSPIAVGAILLNKAKLVNLKFHYTIAKPSAADFPNDLYHLHDRKYSAIIELSRQIIDSIYLVYSDTDSLCYHMQFSKKAKGIDLDYVYKNTFLKPFLDRSNFKILDRESGFRPGSQWKMKIETSDNIPLDAFFISSKVYSIALKKRENTDNPSDLRNQNQTVREFKRAAKGCAKSKTSNILSHEVYKEVYDGVTDCPSVEYCSFRYNEKYGAIVTQVNSKIPLSMREDKRFWLCKDRSVAYGHFLAYENGYRDGDVLCVKGGVILPLDQNQLPDQIDISETSIEDIDLYNTLYGLMLTEEESALDDDFSDYVNFDPSGEAPEIVFGNSRLTNDQPAPQCSHKRKSVHNSDRTLEPPRKR